MVVLWLLLLPALVGVVVAQEEPVKPHIVFMLADGGIQIRHSCVRQLQLRATLLFS